jgi:hypothetical protein
LPSISCSSRARKSERGFALVAAISLAILYFALVELMLIDSARELKEARRFRAKVVAATLAENGAELAAAQMMTRYTGTESDENWQGRYSGRMTRTASTDGSGEERFVISGDGETTGTERVRAHVEIRGRILPPSDIRIQYAVHSH